MKPLVALTISLTEKSPSPGDAFSSESKHVEHRVAVDEQHEREYHADANPVASTATVPGDMNEYRIRNTAPMLPRF